jgi:GlpG protein
MRQIAELEREDNAQRFVAYLVTEGITAHVEPDGDGWAIWVRDENHVQTAKDAFEDFRRDPDGSRYRGVERAADSIRREESKRREQAGKNVIEMRGKWGRAGARRRPLVLTMIALSVIVGMASNMGNARSGAVMRTLSFCDTLNELDVQWNPNVTADRLIDIRKGELWRLITPIFLHHGPIHLAFNMIMLYQLGGMIEDRRGTWRIGLMILAIALVSNLVQGLVPLRYGGSPYFLGMSGVVFGLFGYIWMKTVYAPQLGLFVSRSTVFILMLWLFLGIANFFEQFGMHIANWCHGIGFLVGVVIGYAPELFKSVKPD